jgi:hypothetical protein
VENGVGPRLADGNGGEEHTFPIMLPGAQR